MKKEFISGFSEKLNGFVAQKNSIGSPYEGSKKYLVSFDRMCYQKFPGQDKLSREICMQWAIKKETEQNNSFNNRLAPIREFGKYLLRTGEKAFILPADFGKKPPRRTPYIYSEQEVCKIWDYYDNLKTPRLAPAKPIVLSGIIRTLYCCGLRPIEATRLEVKDVNISAGKLFIKESKGHKDRIVMLSDDLVSYYQKYDRIINGMIPNRQVFFPNANGGAYDVIALDKSFRFARAECGISGTSDIVPRLYDFRHTFATHRLYKWMKEGKDLSVMIPYLSAYMGHTELSDTYYYIHLVPGQFETMTAFDYSHLERLIPEVNHYADCE